MHVSASEVDQSICLQVVDEGSGIPATDRPRIFEKFYRGSNVTAEGSGLGLAIAATLLHGGDISVAPGARNGTIVTITLPIAPRS